MPPTSAATAPAALRRSHTKSADKLIPKSSTPVISAVPPQTNTIRANLEPSQKDPTGNPAVTGKNPQPPSHAATLVHRSSPKARVTDPGRIKVDTNGGLEKSVGPERSTRVGKKKIVKKMVKVLKKVIVKKRVPIRGLVKSRNGEESNQETKKSLNLDVAKTSPVCGEAMEKRQKTKVELGAQVVDEVEGKPSLVNEVVRIKIGPFARDESGFDFKEAEDSKCSNGGARGLGEKGNMSCTVDSKSNVGTRVTQEFACEKDNAKDVKILNDACNPGSVESGTGQAIKADYVANKGDLRNVGDKRGNYPIQNRETNSVVLNEGLLLSGEMERRKRRTIEIFVGGLDKGTTEEDIRNVFGEAGQIVEVRLASNGKTGKHKCFAFVRFASADGLDNALRKYSKVEIRGNMCDVSPAEGNAIYLGHIDRNWKNADVVQFVEKAGILKMDRVVLKDKPNETGKNRGFAFVIFETSKDAEIAFRKLCQETEAGKLEIKVEWAQSFKSRKKMKHVAGTQATMKPNESRNKRKHADISYIDSHANVHTGSFTTARFVHSFRQQPTTNYISPPPVVVPSFPDHRFPLPGTKRPFPFMGHDPRYMERSVLPPQHFGTSHPIPGPSASFNGFSTALFPYYHQQRPGFTPGWNMYPSHFQTNVQAAPPPPPPHHHYGNYSSYPTN